MNDNDIIIEVIVTFFICLVALTASNSHIYSSIIAKHKNLNTGIQIFYTCFIYMLLFMLEGLTASFIDFFVHPHIKIISFSFFVFMSLMLLYNSVNIRDFRSVNRIVYESYFSKLPDKIKDLNNKSNNDIVKTPDLSEKAVNVNRVMDIADQFVPNSNDISDESKNNSSILKESKDELDNTIEINTRTTAEVHNPYMLIKNEIENNNEQAQKTYELFHHENKENFQEVLEYKVDGESQETVQDYLYVLTYLIICGEFENYNFMMFLVYSLIVNKQIFLITCILTSIIFFVVILGSNGKVDSICFVKLKSIVFGFAMIILASYTYNKEIS